MTIKQALFFLLFGLGFVAAGIFIHLTSRAYSDGVTATGVVVDVAVSESTSNGRSEEVYSPIIEFTDPSTGTTYRTVRDISTASRPTIGDEWQVSFRPTDPDGARVLSRWDIWFAALFFVPGLLVTLKSFSVMVRRGL